jgi:iron complex transport system ATP-binding protein
MSLVLDRVSYSVKDNILVSKMDLQVSPGEVLGIVGPNGAGKSTVLKLLAGDLRPLEGVVMLEGNNIETITPLQLSLYRSFMTQTAHIVFDFTVREIVAMGWVQNIDAFTKSKAIKEIIEVCDITDLSERRFNTLSGGEQQRVQFARNLLQLWRPCASSKPRYLLLDEPTASMDMRYELGLLNHLRQTAGHFIGVVIVIHDLNLAARFMDRLILMNHGKVIAEGAPEVVLDPNRLSDVYQTPIKVERNDLLDRLLVHS